MCLAVLQAFRTNHEYRTACVFIFEPVLQALSRSGGRSIHGGFQVRSRLVSPAAADQSGRSVSNRIVFLFQSPPVKQPQLDGVRRPDAHPEHREGTRTRFLLCRTAHVNVHNRNANHDRGLISLSFSCVGHLASDLRVPDHDGRVSHRRSRAGRKPDHLSGLLARYVVQNRK